MNPTPVFKDDLEFGHEQEARVRKLLNAAPAPEGVYAFDMTVNGKTIELKADRLAAEKGNFFFEYYSNKHAGTLGGPWRAKNSSVDYFAYFVIGTGHLYLFDTDALAAKLERYRNAGSDLITYKDVAYTSTTGYVANIHALVNLMKPTIIYDIDTLTTLNNQSISNL